MDLRDRKALELAARYRLVHKDGVGLVPSQSAQGTYHLNPSADAPACACDDFQLRREPCKHLLAVRYVLERDGGMQAPARATADVPPKPTSAQDWPAYNFAQTTEKHRFQVLLHALCQTVPEFPYKGGRRRAPMADMLFACAFKVSSTVSTRRFACDLKDAHAKGYLTKLVHYNQINAYLESPDLTPILQALVVPSSLPLRGVESTFAPDSSGFASSRLVRWFDEKYGVHRSGHDGVQVPIMTGVKTNIVTAIAIKERDANDSPQFKPLVETTAQHFTIKEVPADKAYLRNENLELVNHLGGTAFVPFQSNSTRGEAGRVWERMFHYYQFRREEFLQHYHKRSNAESTFRMVKAKFRDHVRSRTDVARKNEVLCKFLCHNICCIIMSPGELGIEPVFWDDPAKGPATLPLPPARLEWVEAV